MGHEIKYYDYPETVNKHDVQNKLGYYVECRCFEEGGHLGTIRWLDSIPPLDCYEDAEKYIQNHDKGWYDNLAVRYRMPVKETAVYKELVARRTAAYQKRNELRLKIHYLDAKSEFIGCKECGSKLSRKHLVKLKRPNFCPVCGCDLRPKSALEAIAHAEAACEKIEKQAAAEEKKMAKNGKIRWLVKIEYHI